jgi:hypothetical protein
MAQTNAQARPTSRTWRDLRATVRYRCAPATFGRVIVDHAEDQVYQRAWLADLSQSGAGLVMSRPVGVDVAVHLVLRNPVSQQLVLLQGRVIHATQQISGDWLIGCQFTRRLSHQELDDLLA